MALILHIKRARGRIMKKTIFLPLFFILMASLPLWAQESEEVPSAPADQELLKLKLKVDCSEDNKYVGWGCGGGLEDAAKTFSILKAIPSSSGGIVPDSLYLEKHLWKDDRFTISNHTTELVTTEDSTDTIISYPYCEKGGILKIKYRVGAFDPETKTQDVTVESIRGLASMKENGEETKKNLSYHWKIKQNEDGSLELWETDPEFKLQNLEMGIGATRAGSRQGATYLERQGEREVEAEDGTKQRVPVNQREIVLKASCSDSLSPIEKIMQSTQTIFEKI